MKKIIIKTISVILVFVFSIFLLASCFPDANNGSEDKVSSGGNCNHQPSDFFPEGYTCGFPNAIRQPGAELEFWWVETYEECVAAMELLKSHGSTFEETAIFTYEGDLFDTKYCFKISTNDIYTEKIKFGDDPFDRVAWNVEVLSYAFFEDVTIDEINYGDVTDYTPHCIVEIYNDSCVEKQDFSFETVCCEFYERTKVYFVYDVEKTALFLSVSDFGYDEDFEKSKECLKVVLNSTEFIGFDD